MAISLPMRDVSSWMEHISKASSSQFFAFCSVNSASRNWIISVFAGDATSYFSTLAAAMLLDDAGVSVSFTFAASVS